MTNSVVFYGLAGVAVFGAMLMVTRRKALHSAACLTVTLLATAGIFLQLQSRILFVIQVLFLTGAMMGLFVAVVKRLEMYGVARKAHLVRRIGMFLLMVLALGGEAALMFWSARKMPFARLLAFGSNTAAKMAPEARAVMRSLFGSYQLAFVIAVVLLMVAAVGALAMTRQKVESGDALD
jgi:NADH-quinone oxidoreductase subunit J